MKYNPIENRTDKAYLRTFPGNFEIDSVIGKQTNRTALMKTKDIINSTMHIRKYERTMQGFRDALKSVIVANEVDINNPTMDNGDKNNLLWEIVDWSKLFNCNTYRSGGRGTLESAHRIIQRVIPKGVLMDNY